MCLPACVVPIKRRRFLCHPAGPPALGTRYRLSQTFFTHPCRKLSENRHVYAAPAKHSKSFSSIDAISVGVDRTQRNFETQANASGSMPPNRAKL
jgi:hypothetical protein